MQATHSHPVHPENGLGHTSLPTERFHVRKFSAVWEATEAVAVLNGFSASVMKQSHACDNDAK